MSLPKFDPFAPEHRHTLLGVLDLLFPRRKARWETLSQDDFRAQVVRVIRDSNSIKEARSRIRQELEYPHLVNMTAEAPPKTPYDKELAQLNRTDSPKAPYFKDGTHVRFEI